MKQVDIAGKYLDATLLYYDVSDGHLVNTNLTEFISYLLSNRIIQGFILEIIFLQVDKGSRRQGIGKRWFEQLELNNNEHIIVLECSEVYTDDGSFVEEAYKDAIKFYESLGFEEIPGAVYKDVTWFMYTGNDAGYNARNEIHKHGDIKFIPRRGHRSEAEEYATEILAEEW